MKTSYPLKEKRKIRFCSNSNNTNILYAVICQFNDGSWGLADFWDLPYTTRRYLDVVQQKRRIREKATEIISNAWDYKDFSIIKITL